MIYSELLAYIQNNVQCSLFTIKDNTICLYVSEDSHIAFADNHEVVLKYNMCKSTQTKKEYLNITLVDHMLYTEMYDIFTHIQKDPYKERNEVIRALISRR